MKEKMQACMQLNSPFGKFQCNCNIAELVSHLRNNHSFYLGCLKIFFFYTEGIALMISNPNDSGYVHAVPDSETEHRRKCTG